MERVVVKTHVMSELPASCRECEFMAAYNTYLYTERWCPYVPDGEFSPPDIPKTGRPDWCPLEEVMVE